MESQSNFQEAVYANKVEDIRIMMKNSLLFDRTFNELNEMIELSKNVVGLYDEHDNGALVEDKAKWDDEYMANVMVELMDNFSYERLNHLKEVVRYLRPVQVASPKTSAASSTVSTSSNGTSTETSRQQTVRQETAKSQTYGQQNQQTQTPRPQPRVVGGGHSSSGEDKVIKIAGGAVVGGVAGGAISGIAGGSVIVGALIGAAVGGVAMAVIANGDW